jgi:plastocyanin
MWQQASCTLPCGRSRHRAVVACLLATIALTITACGAGSRGSQAATTATPTAYQMQHPQIVENEQSHHPDSFYDPDPIRVSAGQPITYTNKDSDPHDVTSDTGLFASGPIASGASYTLILRTPGTYHYFCTLHPDMHGTIIVSK